PAPNVKLFFAEGLIRSVSEPPLPIQRLDINRFAVPPSQIVLPPVGPDLRHPSQAASLNQFHGVTKVAPAPLLHAALQNPFAGTDRVRQRGTLFDGVSDWLFQVDIFARSNGIDGHAYVPMVGRRDDNGIEWLIKHFAVIRMRGGGAVRA